MENKNNIQIAKLGLDDVNTIVTGIVDALFNRDETSGSLGYKGQYSEVIRAYMEMVFAFPDLELHRVGLEDFFDRYCDGEYDKNLELMRKDRRVRYIEDAVDNTVQNLLRYYSGSQLQNSATNLINKLNQIIDQHSDTLNALSADDIKTFIKGFSEFAGKTDAESLVSTILDKHKSAAKPRKATKSTKTESKSE